MHFVKKAETSLIGSKTIFQFWRKGSSTVRWQGLLVGVGALESNQIREIHLKQNQNGEINLRDQTTDHNQLMVQRMPLFTSFLKKYSIADVKF